MSDKLEVHLISPEKSYFEGEADSIMVPGAKSSFSVHVGHAPIISELEPGEVLIKNGSETHRFIIDGGFVEVTNNRVSALIEKADLPTDIDKEETQKNLDEILKQQTNSDAQYEKQAREILKLRTRLRLAE